VIGSPKTERFVVFSEIKKAVSILQILDRYDLTGSLHRSGDNLMGVCPHP